MQLCGYEVGNRRPFFLIAGPCVIESEAMALDIAHQMKEITAELGIPYIFKASYDKANRTSGKSFRGLGMEKGLEILAKVRAEVGVPVLTDVHTEAEVPAVAAVVDVPERPVIHAGRLQILLRERRVPGHSIGIAGRGVQQPHVKAARLRAPEERGEVPGFPA